MGVGTAIAIGSAVTSMVGGAVAGNQAKKAQSRAERAQQRAQNNLDRVRNSRVKHNKSLCR